MYSNTLMYCTHLYPHYPVEGPLTISTFSPLKQLHHNLNMVENEFIFLYLP